MTEDDEFDSANPDEAFVRFEDIEGRLVCAFAPVEFRKQKGTNGPYEAAFADLLILDGEPHALFDPVPPGVNGAIGVVQQMMFTTDRIIRMLKRVEGTGRPLLGRPETRPSKFRTKAFGLSAPTAADRELARGPVAQYRKVRADQEDPFS